MERDIRRNLTLAAVSVVMVLWMRFQEPKNISMHEIWLMNPFR